MLLKAAYREIHAGGSSYKAASFFQRTLSSKEIKIKPKIANIPGLQLADLLAYPAKMRMLEEHGRNKPATGFTKEMADLFRKEVQPSFCEFAGQWIWKNILVLNEKSKGLALALHADHKVIHLHPTGWIDTSI
jgi:hypothetical protein